jgi:1-acyl-sn-glycerol-3-phosphate acyltransferase
MTGSHARGIARAAGFLAWTLAVGGAWCAVRWALSPARRTAGSARVLGLWSRGLCRLLGIRVATTGAPARGPVLLAANHIGYLDIVVLASVAPALFVSKSDLAGWPLMGPLAAAVDTLFLDRARPRSAAEVGAGVLTYLDLGRRVIIFPEGTTTRGDIVGPFHAALFEPAVGACARVQGALLAYTPRSPRDPDDLAAWTGEAAFAPHLYRLFRGRGLDATVVFQEKDARPADRRAAAEGARSWMTGMLGRLRGPGPVAPDTVPPRDPGARSLGLSRSEFRRRDNIPAGSPRR